MKPKYNILDEVYWTDKNVVFLEKTTSTITEIEDLSFDKTGDFHYRLSDCVEWYSEKEIANKQEYKEYLLEKSAELITLANKLEEDVN